MCLVTTTLCYVCLFQWIFHLIIWFIREITQTLAWMFTRQGFSEDIGSCSLCFWRHWACIVVLLQTSLCGIRASPQTEREWEGGREREETDSQDLDEPWEKRGLVEEKQKCLRTFLCDYTVLEKSRHSCSYSVSEASQLNTIMSYSNF